MSDLIETKLPKGRKWTDEDVIIIKNKELMGGRISFYPVGDNLYTKGLWIKLKKIVDETKEGGYTYHREFPKKLSFETESIISIAG